MHHMTTSIMPSIWTIFFTALLLLGQASSLAQTPEVPLSATVVEAEITTLESTPKNHESAAFSFSGQIVYIEVEGGFYAIETIEGQKLNPLNLPVALQEAGKSVTGNAIFTRNMMGIHMWGQYVNLVDIMETAAPCETDTK